MSRGRQVDICQVSGKTVYPTRDKATEAIGQWSQRTTGTHKKPRTAYHCKECRAWHITTMSPDHSRKIQKSREKAKQRRRHEAD